MKYRLSSFLQGVLVGMTGFAVAGTPIYGEDINQPNPLKVCLIFVGIAIIFIIHELFVSVYKKMQGD